MINSSFSSASVLGDVCYTFARGIIAKKEEIILKIGLILALSILLLGCETTNKALLVKISEASGICFSKKSHTLFVVGDEGNLYEITTNGRIVRQKHLGNYDLEGIACDDQKEQLLLAHEGKDAIMIVNQKSFNIQKVVDIKRKYRGKLILKKDKKNGLEGITIINDKIFLSNQSNVFFPKKDPSVLFSVDKKAKAKVAIKRLYDHGYQDIAGLDYHDKKLYMVSDKEDLLLVYDIKEKKVLKEVKLPPFSQEGVALDDVGYIYFANDEGSILKYKRTTLGL